MTDPAHDNALPLDALIVRYAEARLDAAGVAALDAALQRDPAARDRFVALLTHARCLAELLTTEASFAHSLSPRERAGVRAEHPLRPSTPTVASPAFRLPRPFILAASLLLAASAFAIVTLALNNRQSPIDNPQSPPAPLASVTDVVDGTLMIDDQLATAGNDYAGRSISLDAGEAEFMLPKRVTARLRGKTRLILHDAMNVAMASGWAEFDCPPSAKGFTVHLPDRSKIVDLGTRFAAEIIGDSCRLRVLEGRVRLDRPGPDGAAVEVDAGTLVRIHPDGSYEIAEPDPTAIALTGPVEGFVEAPHPDPRDSGLAFTVGPKPLLVYAMGFEDVGGDGLAVDHEVALFRTDIAERIATVTVPAGSDAVLIDRWRYVALSGPLMLEPGVRYTLAAARHPADPITDRYPSASFELTPAVTDPAAVYNHAPTDDLVIAEALTAHGPQSDRWSPANLRFKPLVSETQHTDRGVSTDE